MCKHVCLPKNIIIRLYYLQFSDSCFDNTNDLNLLQKLNVEAFDLLTCDDFLFVFSHVKSYVFDYLINNLTHEIIQQTNAFNSAK